MNAAQSISTIFNKAKELVGPTKAKHVTSDIVHLAIEHLLQEGLPVSEENIHAKLEKFALDFVSSKSSVA